MNMKKKGEDGYHYRTVEGLINMDAHAHTRFFYPPLADRRGNIELMLIHRTQLNQKVKDFPKTNLCKDFIVSAVRTEQSLNHPYPKKASDKKS